MVVVRDLVKGHTQMTSNPRHITSADLFLFFHAPKSFNKPFEFLLYKTNRLHFPVCVYCNRLQKTSQRVKNNSHATRLRLVSSFFCSLHAVTSSVIYYSTHTWKNVIYLLNIYILNYTKLHYTFVV